MEPKIKRLCIYWDQKDLLDVIDGTMPPRSLESYTGAPSNALISALVRSFDDDEREEFEMHERAAMNAASSIPCIWPRT